MNRRKRALVARHAQRADEAFGASDFKNRVERNEVAVPQPLDGEDVPIGEDIEAGQETERSTPFDIVIRKVPNHLF